MRFDYLKAKGVGVFRDEIAIDLDSLPGTLVGITGANGSGKSSLLELLFAGMTRECPTRGSLVDLARDRDAYVEVTLTNGARHTIRHTLDAVSKKSEALVLDAGGAAVLPTTSVKAFDEWARAHLPAPEVMLNSLFAPQQHGGFCDASPRERKAVLSRLLGIEELEGVAERARRRANETREALAGIAGELRALPALDAAATAAELDRARAEAADADRALAQARDDDQAAIAYRGKQAALTADRLALAEIERRLGNNRLCLRDAEKIRAAVARNAEIDAAIADRRRDAQIDAARASDLDRSCRDARARAQRAQDAIRSARARVDAARTRQALRPAIEKARAELPIAQQHVRDLEARLAEIGAEFEEIRTSVLGGAEGRISDLRTALIAIARAPESAGEVAPAAIDADDLRAEALRTGPARERAARTRIAEIDGQLPAARAAVSKIEQTIARAGEVEAADRELAEAAAAGDAANGEEANASAEAVRLDREAEAARAAGREHEASIDRLETEQRGLATLLRMAPAIADAETKIATYEPQIAELRAKIAATEAEIAASPEPKDADVFGCEQRAQRAHAAIGRLEGDLARARETEARRAQLEERKAALDVDLADWALLGEDLGASGLPALLIDAAGPELTALTNELLHTCLGTRFTVAIETTRPSADGKKAIETCEVRVIDTVGGRDASVETFSGGERSIINESVSLALTMLACRRSGVVGPTLIRDETGAALDEANGRAYIAMLRKAAEIVGASHVLFVAHDKQLQELADARLVIDNGKVSVS